MRYGAVSLLLVGMLIAPAPVRAQLEATVVDQESGRPLPYSTIALTAVGSADTVLRFTDDMGQIFVKGLAPNHYHVRARELGFAAADTVIVLADTASPVRVTFRLQTVAHRIAAVVVRGERQCRQAGLPAASDSSESDLAIIASEIRENARRVRLFADAHPFFYQREIEHLERQVPGASLRMRLVDTTTYDSRLHPPYKVGHVVRIVRDSHGNRTRVFVLPTLVDLADTAFERLHCFWFAGQDSSTGSPTLQVDVQPLATLHTPDVTGHFYLDPQTYLVRRATFQLTHPEGVRSALKSETVETHYRELAPLVAVADSVVTTTVMDRPWGPNPDDVWNPESQTFVERGRLVRVWDGSTQAPDTIGLGTIVDADTDDSPLATASTTPAGIRGRIVSPQGEPVLGARLEIIGLGIESVTGDSGQFELKGVPPGDQTLLIRRIGYRPTIVVLPAKLPARRIASREVIVQLPASNVVTLNPVVVTAQRLTVAYKRIGFDERRQTLRGFFLDADQIGAMHAVLLREILGRAPGFQWVHGGPVKGSDLGPVIPAGALRVEGDPSCDNTPQATRDHAVGDNPSCTICIDYFVDGRRQVFTEGFPSFNAFTQLESRYPPNTVAAVEMYGPSAGPPAVTSGGNTDCATVLLWTKKYLGL